MQIVEEKYANKSDHVINKGAYMKDMIRKIFVVGTVILVSQSCSSVHERSMAKEEFKEAAGLTPISWDERKNDFIQKHATRIDDILVDLDSLRDEKLPENMKKESIEKINSTKRYVSLIRFQLSELRTTPAQDWEIDKQEFMTSMNVLEDRFNDVRNMYK